MPKFATIRKNGRNKISKTNGICVFEEKTNVTWKGITWAKEEGELWNLGNRVTFLF